MKPRTSLKRSQVCDAASTVRAIRRGAAEQRARQSLPEHGQSGPRVLLVDDDRVVRESLRELLIGEGYFVIPAENGEQAIEVVNQSAVNLVLLDLNMPVKNGWDTFEELTREHPTLPVIIITARANQLFTAASSGAGALLEKPMDIPTLLQAMRKLLAETAEQRLARLVGRNSGFVYHRGVAEQGKHF
jgi:two-component system response regulator FlrC